MGRPRNPERDKSMQRYLDADGKIETAELAKLAGVPEVRIRKWKSEDSWDEALKNKPIKMLSRMAHLRRRDMKT